MQVGLADCASPHRADQLTVREGFHRNTALGAPSPPAPLARHWQREGVCPTAMAHHREPGEEKAEAEQAALSQPQHSSRLRSLAADALSPTLQKGQAAKAASNGSPGEEHSLCKQQGLERR